MNVESALTRGEKVSHFLIEITLFVLNRPVAMSLALPSRYDTFTLTSIRRNLNVTTVRTVGCIVNTRAKGRFCLWA